MAISNPVDVPQTILPIVLDFPGPPLTDDFIASLCERNPQYRFETDDGRLVMTPGTGFLASGGEAELVRQVANWNAIYDLGFVTSSSGYFRQINDSDIKGPDCAYTSWENIEAQIPPEREDKPVYTQLAPDVTFELTSPTDDLTILDAKCRRYLANRIQLAVLLVSNDQSVRLYRPNSNEPVITYEIGAVVIGDEMPQFALNAQAVFAATRLRRNR